MPAAGRARLMPTLGALVDRIALELRQAGIERPRTEARLIVEAATGLAATRQLTDRDHLVEADAALALAARRAAREPMAYLLGHREFWGIDFQVGPGALVPRPETETLIEQALAAFPDRGAALKILDLGTGTGCLLLTLLWLYPDAIGIGVDRSAEALAWAQANRRALGFERRALLVQADWLEATRGPFDIIVANPPYIAAAEARDLETAHEPAAALIAGADGLAAYRAIAGLALAQLAPSGRLLLEIGATQADAVASILAEAGFALVTRHADLAGRARVLQAHQPTSR